MNLKIFKKELFFITLFLFFTTSCEKKKEKIEEFYYPVKASNVIKKDVPIYIDSIGHIDSINSVSIKPQLSGEIVKIHFKEGEEVNEKDPLFTIDPRPYQNKLNQLNATLQENIANLYLAKDTLQRYQKLVKDDYVSKLKIENLQTNVLRQNALIKQNEAEIDNAKLNLSYCFISSPIYGKTGILKITKGNFVSSEDILISINQLSPIYVTFTLPEKYLSKVQKYFRRETKLKVRTSTNNFSKNKTAEGTLLFIDNQVDNQTAQITLRAIFENKEKTLWPKKFVKTRLILKTKKDALLVPKQAIQITTSGPKIFIIKKDNTVEERKIVLGENIESFVVIKKGIEASEKIVVEGQINLSNNVKVKIKNKI